MVKLVGGVTARDLKGLGEVSVAVLLGTLLEAIAKARDRHAVMGTRWAGEARLDRCEVEHDGTGVRAAGGGAEGSLALEVGTGKGDVTGIAAGEAEVVEGCLVHGEERDGGTVLGRHVGHARALGRGEARDAIPRDLNEAANDSGRPHELGDREGEVHARDAVAQGTREPQLDHGRNEHGDGLPESRGLGLDAADAPAHDANAVCRGRVGVGANERVKAGNRPLERGEGVGRHHAAEALDVELVADAGSGRDDPDVAEGLACPLEEREALVVALCLELLVLLARVLLAGDVGDDRVVHDEGAGDVGVNARGVSPTLYHGIAHGGEVHKDRNSCEVLKQHAGGHELDLGALLARKACLDHLSSALGDADGLASREDGIPKLPAACHSFCERHGSPPVCPQGGRYPRHPLRGLPIG